MRFGLSGCGGGFESGDAASCLSFAVLAEQLGFDALWINEEHFQGPSGGRGRRCLSPVVLAAAFAARTVRIRIGFSVLLLPLHHPLRLAEELATLDVLSEGRLNFGVSRGGNPGYSAAYGVDPSKGREAFEASLSFMRRCWTEPEVQIEAGRYSVQPKPVQLPHPPIFIGTYNEDTARWAGRTGYGLIQHGIQSLPNVRRVMQAYASAGGSAPDVPVGRFVYVSESDASAKRELAPVILDLTDRLRRAGVPTRLGTLSEADLDPERFYEEMVIAGSPDTCVGKLAALRDELGTEYVNCLSSFFGFLPTDRLRASLRLFGTDVMPRMSDSKIAGQDCCCGLHGDREGDSAGPSIQVDRKQKGVEHR
ncbi:MAG: LLM class flavin-dependent oxidoreductase [Nitrospira sp.]|nr:MAG: LLM class flavin-dependent oxidoreductase [Nitrospira sp.]